MKRTGLLIDLKGQGQIINDSYNIYLVKFIDPIGRIIYQLYSNPNNIDLIDLRNYVVHHTQILKI